MFDIDESREAAAFLRLSNDGERERGLTGGFRPENFYDTAARKKLRQLTLTLSGLQG